MTDPVLIVGAGPVGLTMALALKRQGVDVRLIDKAAAPSDHSKALVMWPRTLELLDIQGCAPPLVAAGMKAVGARILAEGKELVKLRLDTALSEYRFALMIPQDATERLLAEQLVPLGVTVDRSVALSHFTDDGHGVSAALALANGNEEIVRASFLVGCDGAHSKVRHALGSSFDGDTLRSDWVLADLELEGELPRDEITICWTSEGLLVFFPIRDTRFRVIADVGGSADDELSPTLDTVRALMAARGFPDLRPHDPVWISRFRINERKVKDYRHGRVFLAGDAAHVHSPAGGQGMNTGMQDAINLAWKLALVWHNHASMNLLDSYSPERSAVGDAVLRNASNLTRVGIVRNPVLQEIRSLAVSTLGRLPPLQQHMVNQLTELDLNYRDGPLTDAPPGAARTPAAGDRAPDTRLVTADGETRLHDILARTKFAVMSVGVEMIDLPKSLRSVAVAAQVAAASGYDDGHVYLVRPDAYVMMSTSEDATPIVLALERIRTG